MVKAAIVAAVPPIPSKTAELTTPTREELDKENPTEHNSIDTHPIIDRN